MNVGTRARRWVLIAMVVGAGSACGAGNQEVVGISDRPAGKRDRPIADAGSPDATGLVPAEYKSSFRKLNRGRVVSLGHATGRWEIDVWANEIAARAMSTQPREVPVGAIVVVEHFERGASTAAGPVMVMEKRDKGESPEHGDWRYLSVGASGAPARNSGACAGCHDEAPMDGFFPINE